MLDGKLSKTDRLLEWATHTMSTMLGRRCVLCLEPCDAANLCAHCLRVIPRLNSACVRCARPLHENEPHRTCGRCLTAPPPWATAHAATVYESPVVDLISMFKFGGDLAAGRALATLMVNSFSNRLPVSNAVVMPVPAHRSRLRKRGFNQALELARPLGRILGCAVEAGTLTRLAMSEPQSTVRASRRGQNVKGAFGLSGPPPTSIILVDDVMTTGSTLAECSRVLLAGGARHVVVCVAARAVAQVTPYTR